VIKSRTYPTSLRGIRRVLASFSTFHSRSARRRHMAAGVMLFGLGLSLVSPTVSAAATGDTLSPATTIAPASGSTAAPKPMYAMYYLWWSQQHWKDKLGPNYPYTQSPLPLPSSLGANGCTPVSKYQGNHLVDVPTSIAAYNQDDPKVIEQDVRNAAKAGLRGFLANWAGTGDPNQTVSSVSYSKRLQYLVDATHKVNAEGTPFKLWIAYKASDSILSDAHISGDLTYLARQYGNDSAFDHTFSSRLMLIWQGSRKYGLSHIQTISRQFRGSFFFVGDENWNTWGDGRASYLDGDSYYWSSQDPYQNPQSFSQVQKLAAMVRQGPANPDGSVKLWFAPVAPGFDTIVNGTGNTCVPRTGPNGTSTLQTLFTGNTASNPDGWTLISWNEVAENTFVMPLQRWGWRELTTLSHLLGGSL
jgi:hypothetical protein